MEEPIYISKDTQMMYETKNPNKILYGLITKRTVHCLTSQRMTDNWMECAFSTRVLKIMLTM